MSQRTTGHFSDSDLEGLFDENPTPDETEPWPTDVLIAEIESELGYRLPDAYVELCRVRNGGTFARSCHPMPVPTGWAEDHIAVTTLSAIGRTAAWSLLGGIGVSNWLDEWGYPRIGVPFLTTPTAGHEMIFLDYRECGPHGEPAVSYVDQEDDFSIQFVASDFATFVKGLVDPEAFEPSEEDVVAEREALVERLRAGRLSPIITRAAAAAGDPGLADLVRVLATRIAREKGHFSLHAEPQSLLMYDLMFWLHGHLADPRSLADFAAHPREQSDYSVPYFDLMITTSFVADPYQVRTGGFAPGHLDDWWENRLTAGSIGVESDGVFRMAPTYAEQMVQVLRALA